MDKEALLALAKAKTSINTLALAFSALGVAAAGAAAGYQYAVRKLSEEFIEELELEVERTKKHYSQIKKTEYPTVQDAADALLPISRGELKERVASLITQAEYGDPAPEEPGMTQVAQNIFTDVENWDADAEEAQRDPSKPYILEHDEFYTSDRNSVTLTWFAGDGVLSDEKDEFVPDVDAVVGEANLERFGHGSRDPLILYVRNEGLDLDFEIVYSENKYTKQILGFDVKDDDDDESIQHSSGPRRFRQDRDE
jgi:hypothetical protein